MTAPQPAGPTGAPDPARPPGGATAPPLPPLRDGTDLLVRRHRDGDPLDALAGLDPHPAEDGPPAAQLLAEAEQRWRTQPTGPLAVVVEGAVVGAVDLLAEGAGAAQLRCLLVPQARGRHLMSRSVRLVLAWAFEQRDLQVVHWRRPVGDWPARRLVWACGFLHEGTQRGLVWEDGRLRDGWAGSLRRGEPLRAATSWFEAAVLADPDGLVRLRPWAATDAERVREACCDPLSQQWLPSLPQPYTRDDSVAYLASRPEEMAAGLGVYWCVADPGSDLCLASIALMMRGDGCAELGWWAHPDARGRGVVTTAARLVARHASGPLGLHRLLVRTAAGNPASTAVATRLGFTPVGRDRQAQRQRGGHYEDDLRHDLLAGELASP